MKADAPSIQVLLIEDNAGDAVLLREAWQQADIRYALTWVRDGVEAIEYLRVAARRPDLTILDLNLPRMSGQQVLAALAAEKDWGRFPLVVLTSSEIDQDAAVAAGLPANSYFVKPRTYDALCETVRVIEKRRLELVA